MSVENTVKYKSKCFAIRIIKLYKLQSSQKTLNDRRVNADCIGTY
jgi:hypothetical protein